MSAYADEARRQAADVLDERRFHGTDLPRPLRGPLERLGERLQDLLDAIVDLLPGGRVTAWVLLVLGVVALGAALAAAGTRRQVRVHERQKRAARAAEDSPAELVRRADEAERAGELAAAVRLRFRAGLLDLDGRGALDLRPAMPTGEIRRRLRSPTFDDLAGTFEEVAYGGRQPGPEDVAAARERWPEVGREVARR